MPSRRKPWPAGAAIALPILALLLAIGGGLFWRSQMRGPIVAAPRPPSSAPAATVLATSAIPDKSIAVLPFENLSGRAEDAYLADGLQEEILNALARVRDLKVISRTSVQEYRGKSLNVREIGQRLGVRTVLEGSVRLQGPTLRLTIQLIDARDDHHLLATNYDRKLTNVLDLQSTVARLVANALSATLTRYEHGEFERIATNSGDAYDRYLHAQALFRRPTPEDDSGVVESKRLLDEALVFDPDYADALAMLSQANTWIYFGSNDPAAGAAAKQAFERAFVLDPDLPEARLARGIYAMYVTKDMDQAMSDLDAVVALRPNSSEAHQLLGFALRRRGSMVEAIQHLTRAWDLDPLNPARDGGPLITLLGLRRYPEAIEQTRIDSARFPNEAGSYFVRARLLGRLQHSLAPLRAALRDHGSLLDAPSHKAIEAEIAQAEGRFQDAIALLGQSPAYVPMVRARRIGMLYYAAGDPARARRTLQDAERVEEAKRPQDVSIDGLRNLAVVQSLLGQHDAALASIERARSQTPEATDVVNGPSISFDRAIILVRAGRGDEGYAEATRLLRVPFGAPFFDLFGPRDSWELMPEARDPRFAVLINDPPRL